MGPARIVGLVILGLVLLGAGRFGAPPYLLVLIAVVDLGTLLIPGDVGAKAAGNLARKIYDRRAWESGWSTGYLPDDEDRSERKDVRALPEADRRASGPWRQQDGSW